MGRLGPGIDRLNQLLLALGGTLWLPLFDGTEVVQVSTGAVSVSGARVPVIDSVSRPRSPASP